MEWLEHFFIIPPTVTTFEIALIVVRKIISIIGILIIFWGAIIGVYQFLFLRRNGSKEFNSLDSIRLKFGRTILLGLEFIVAADIIATTSAPDFYSVGILASLVGIRTFFTYFMNREINRLANHKHD